MTTSTIADVNAVEAEQVGLQYVFGGIGLKGSADPGVDCSGLPYASCAKCGKIIPRTSELQFADLPAVSVLDLRQGDLELLNVPGDTQAQPAHVVIWWSPTVRLQAPHTGAVVEFCPPLPYEVMGYRRLPFPDASVATPPPPPPAVVSTVPASLQSSNPQEITMGLPSSCSDSGAVRAQIREWWTTYRSDVMTAGDQNLLQLCFAESTGAGGFGGNPDLMLANIIDGAKTAGTLRPQFVNAV